MDQFRHLRIAGAMGVGKSTVCRPLAGHLPGCVLIDADILGTEMVATTQPEPDYDRFHHVLLQLAFDIGLSGLRVAYHGPVHPRQVESSPLSRMFDTRWLVLVADPDTRFQRALSRGSTEASYVRNRAEHDALDRDLRLLDTTNPSIRLVDTTQMTPEEVTGIARDWAAAALAD
jgi:hypothetical protein